MFQSAFKYQKPRYDTKLNLVSLMDIFTILVFFLLLNSGEAEKLENAEFVELPDSQSGTQPHEELVVMVGDDAIWLDEERLVAIEEVPAGAEEEVEPLAAALAEHRERRGELNSYEEENGLALTIMADRRASYRLLKKVMATSRLEDFRNISLAVNQVGSSNAPAEEAPDLASAPAAGGGR